MARGIRMNVPKYRPKNIEQQAQTNLSRQQKLVEWAKKKQTSAAKHSQTTKNQKPTDNSKEVAQLKRQLEQVNQRFNREKSRLEKQNRQQAKQLKEIKKENHRLRLAAQQAEADKEATVTAVKEEMAAERAQLQQERDFLTSIGWDGSEDLAERYRRQTKLVDWWASQYLKSAAIFVRATSTGLANLDREQKLTHRFQVKSANLRRQIEQLKKENSQLQSKYDKLKTTAREQKKQLIQDSFVSIPQLFQQLLQRLSAETYLQYDDGMDQLTRKYQKLFNQVTTQSLQQASAKRKGKSYRMAYGYLKLTPDGPYIHDINQEHVFPLDVTENLVNSKEYVDGAPIKAARYKSTNNFYLVRIFTTLDRARAVSQRQQPAKKAKRETVPTTAPDQLIELTNPATLDWLRDKAVLVVGNKRAQAFADAMRPYVTVRLMDAYEANPKQVFAAMGPADFVFILIDSIPHAITDYTKDQPDLAPDQRKVQIFRNPSRDAGVARLNYLYATRKPAESEAGAADQQATTE